MLHVLRPRFGAHGHALICRPKAIGSGCARRGRRRLSTTSEPSKPAGSPSADDEPGWPLKVCPVRFVPHQEASSDAGHGVVLLEWEDTLN